MRELSSIALAVVALLGTCGCGGNVEIDATTSFLKAFERGCQSASNADYGRSETSAIKLGSPESADPMLEGRRNRTYFLLSLRGPNGERVRYTRLGSCCAQPGPHGHLGREMLDIFQVTHRGLDEPIDLYFNVYSFDDPRVPVGLTFEPTVMEDWTDVMWQNPWWTTWQARGLTTP